MSKPKRYKEALELSEYAEAWCKDAERRWNETTSAFWMDIGLQKFRDLRSQLAAKVARCRRGLNSHIERLQAAKMEGRMFLGIGMTLGVVLAFGGEIIIQPTSMPKSSKAGNLKVQISASSDSTSMPIIVGNANLPDGVEPLVDVRRWEAKFFAQDPALVVAGAFKAGPFSSRGAPLPPGTYEVSISLPVARLQPALV
ncbi:hypothetical protein [Microvirga makkahensis]|uniref:Uncharacterized protein n=1 Tax=Microvirga makkahensis TaxID=1128670 RepID=A0A7X3SS77_9HYPH|nr:hypothetical protein [Microvirga makkahensis]MXQ14854.1 hypothetical protein [Microvirga makkahensis]